MDNILRAEDIEKPRQVVQTLSPQAEPEPRQSRFSDVEPELEEALEEKLRNIQ